MKDKFLDIVSSPIMNLDHTKRYSGTKLVEEESLSQHIVDTIMFGIKVIDDINNLGGFQINESEYIRKAIYHDLEEVVTGDFPRPIKYYNEHIKDELDKVADKVAMEFFTTQFHTPEDKYTIWKYAKLGPEGVILKIVDNLVVVNKVIKEVLFLNNNYMLKVAREVVSYTTELRDKRVYEVYIEDVKVREYLYDLLDNAVSVLENIIEDNSEFMREYKIQSHSVI